MNHFFKKAKSYEKAANQHFENAYNCLSLENELLYRPYFDASFHTSSLVYPLCHTLKTFIAIGRILQGTWLLIEALFNDDLEETSERILTGMGNELLTCFLDIGNIFASVLSIISRTVASLINGYSENTMKNSIDFSNPLALFQSSNILESLANGITYNVLDAALYESTTTLSM
ncbi:hypothetical protein [Legionella shakespearei]|uniref:Uncharacterized protein n=1 Tax=Legionella shakespearei DSM 23087 TaxID=1122169 RepID=A0A0W0YSR0_9GAMM|nr:hypothetical protein [Legionella shakespearei]KTD59909.1 hypothetical protein Lsha_1659 [Legionella shakespearei DSM 23087]